ncbi:hypothetical protein FRB95_010368 [Tulasnella sp. JGI-2019a]|nr:hypothetical protein FRB95_010368 [Tulasnella sp. JGI-2019a]
MHIAIFISLLLPTLAIAMAQAPTTVSGVALAESGAITQCISSCSTQGATAAGCSSL